MAHKAASVKKSSEPLPGVEEFREVGRIGTRELRNRFREMCEYGAPLIVTRGRREVAALIPINLSWYINRGEVRAAGKALRKAADRIAHMLGNW